MPDRAVAGGAVASVGPQDNRSYGDGPEVTLTSAHRLLVDLAHGRCRPGSVEVTGGREKVPAKGRFSTGRDGHKAMLAAGRKFRDRTQAVEGAVASAGTSRSLLGLVLPAGCAGGGTASAAAIGGLAPGPVGDIQHRSC